MKSLFKIMVFTIFISFYSDANSQDNSSALAYMQFLGDQYKPISKDMWDYMSAIARGKNARKVDNKRKELIKTILNSKKIISASKPYKGDSGLRDSTVAYLVLNYNILNEDYDKIVDLEEIAEQSYDQMEAYILVRKQTNEKINSASEAMEAEEKRFAAQNNINLIQVDSKLSKKLERAGEAFDYYDEIFLVHFKSQIQESNIISAMNKQDINAVEQGKNALKQYSEEGLEALLKFKPFKGDATLIVACKNLFNFYKKEADVKFPVIIDFYLKKENYDEMKKIMDSKGKTATKEEINNYNKSMNDYNILVNKFNTVNQELNKERTQKINDWNNAIKVFLDKHAS